MEVRGAAQQLEAESSARLEVRSPPRSVICCSWRPWRVINWSQFSSSRAPFLSPPPPGLCFSLETSRNAIPPKQEKGMCRAQPRHQAVFILKSTTPPPSSVCSVQCQGIEERQEGAGHGMGTQPRSPRRGKNIAMREGFRLSGLPGCTLGWHAVSVLLCGSATAPPNAAAAEAGLEPKEAAHSSASTLHSIMLPLWTETASRDSLGS